MPDGWTVSELNRYVRQSLEKDYRLQDVRVAGEISGFRPYPSGHWYFTLKDSGAQINCVMWRGRAQAQSFRPRDGDAVLALGSVSLYEARGQYQLDVAWLQPAGEGALYREFVRLKARLEAEGLFAPERKRPLPVPPRTIGLVTSPAGAALRDMLNILRRRFPLARVILSPTPVQGADAPPQIVAALEAIANFEPDVVILARGGGALEDLWCFNDEQVARAIVACPAPVVSGVGHETDFTIADFAADVRAPTPSAAAELVTALMMEDLRAAVEALDERVARRLKQLITESRWALDQARAALNSASPQAQLESARQRVDELALRATLSLTHRLALARERVNGLKLALNSVSPLAVLGRGYAVVSRADGSIVHNANDVKPGDPLRVRVSEGEFGVKVSA
ncbi:MAG: exodeoxyribonuclease VII large subunit [Anaerolineales bacterium]